MNLNHIAKKPFFDLFYAKPVMPALLRAAIYDATALNTDGTVRGPHGTATLKNQLAIAKSKELKLAIAEVKMLKANGNHITHMLSISDLIQLGGYAAVEYCGGPSMVFRMGREVVHGEADVVQHDSETFYNSLNIARLARMNLSAADFVALVGGS
jgi:L-ascorbate peroxidase